MVHTAVHKNTASAMSATVFTMKRAMAIVLVTCLTVIDKAMKIALAS